MKKFLILSFFYTKSFSQSISDSRTNSLSNSNIADINPTSSAFNNPCGIIFQENPIFIFNYSNYLEIDELSKINLGFINLIKENDFAYGANLERFGYSLYNENKISIFSSKKLYSWLELGLKTNFFYNQIKEINVTQYFFTIDLGFNYYINHMYLVSIFLENITSQDVKNNSNVRSGLNYREYKFLNIFLEYQHFLYFKNDIKLGFEYNILEKFNISSGVSIINKNFGLGLGVNLDEFKFYLGFVYSSNLNINVSSFLSYETKF